MEQSPVTARHVSVVVPTRDRPVQLGRALASIREVEGPGLRFEIIVGDNGASPETQRVAKAHGAIHVRTAVPGASGSRNAAMACATGEFIAFLDDDDAWLPGHIRPHLALLDRRPDLDGVIGQVRLSDMAHQPLQGLGDWPDEHPGDGDDLVRRMLSGFFPQIGATVVRASVRDTDGYFDPRLIGGEDLDWQMRLAGRHALGFVQTPCILFAQRRVGDYDDLHRQRIAYDRKVFRRHAHRHWKVWRSPRDYMRAYSGTLMHFYRYFVDVAGIAAGSGQRLRALGAIRTAVGIFPLRSAKHLLTSTPLRDALVQTLFTWPGLHRVHLPIWLAILHV